MTDGLHYPDNLYADHEERKARARQTPVGAYRSTDPVTKPAHYQRAGIETIDYIRATLDGPGFEAYCIGNVLKYVSRYREKGGVEDLRKAQVYLGWAIQPVGGIGEIQPESCSPNAIREAKVAYDMACDGGREVEIAGYVACGVSKDAATRIVDAKPGEVVCISAIDAARVIHRHPAGIGDVPHERVPKWDVRWGSHPMAAEAIREHDERPGDKL